MKKSYTFTYIVYMLVFCFIMNSYALLEKYPKCYIFIIPLFLFINIFAGTIILKTQYKRLKICFHGVILLSIFAASVVVSILYHIFMAFDTIPENYTLFIRSAIFCICLETILFYNGMLCIYCTSVQLGMKYRVIGLLCGMIPIVNLIVLKKILFIAAEEVKFETEKEQINIERKDKMLCKTKYPILLVHGVFFRDTKYFNYWGRIPKELEINGAKIYYGNHQSAAAVADSAGELTNRIKEIVKITGCEKVNIVAHSKGGLDCRYAIANLGAAPYVASLTTVNTPHRGCLFADYLLSNVPKDIKNKIAATYNTALKKLGDESPDFLAAVNDLTASACKKFNSEIKTPDGIFCQSIGSKLNNAVGGKFPLNFTYKLVEYFDGPNDGLVSEQSFQWGQRYTFLETDKKRGISHGDIIDFNRENIKGFDVREFYVNLIHDLKERGL